MQIIRSVKDLETFLQQYEDINFVPTMGNLHAGHLSLVSEANKYDGISLVSIFVNPLQFAPNEDLDIYPRTEKQDLKELEKINCDTVFCPEPNFAEGAKKLNANADLSKKLCGISRPHFFHGVISILNHFFQLIKPKNVFFGLKDYQQYLIVKDFLTQSTLKTNIHGVPIVREPDGLAMSSRNNLLTPDQRLIAAKLSVILKDTAHQAKIKNLEYLRVEGIKTLEELNFKVDYFSFCNSSTLEEIDEFEANTLLAIAVNLGGVRLIDNFLIQ